MVAARGRRLRAAYWSRHLHEATKIKTSTAATVRLMMVV
jgi:hypothetical protein